jgi:hypothetical protein
MNLVEQIITNLKAAQSRRDERLAIHRQQTPTTPAVAVPQREVGWNAGSPDGEQK